MALPLITAKGSKPPKKPPKGPKGGKVVVGG